jgi:hypothetical protein
MKKHIYLFSFLLIIFTACTNVESTENAANTVQPTAVEAKKAVNELMDNWHKAAATADEDVFFGSMTEDGIYIGTDASERWLRDELKEWSAEFFDRDKAWDFTPIERQVFFSDDKNIAWFNETLNTWMGVCRSSGVLQMTKDGWKIKQYHLSMTVPNDAVKEYLEMVKKYEK